MIISKYKY